MNDYGDVSLWLEECGPVSPRAALEEQVHAETVIIGAGYTGLWTAYYLLKESPGMKVVILESEVAGFGASGRNGGWCNATMAGLSVSGMEKKWGAAATIAIIRELRGTLDEISLVMDRENIDADLVREGVLRVAIGKHEIPAIEHKFKELESLGLIDGHRLLDREGTREIVGIQGVEGAFHDPFVQTIHPAKLVRGLALAVEHLGGQIYETSRVTGWSGKSPYVTSTVTGSVISNNLVVATEGYSVDFAEYHRTVLPLYSMMVATEPLTEHQWKEVGWTQHFTVSSQRLGVDYVSRSPGGRLLFGGRGAPYHFGSRVEDSFDQHQSTHDLLRDLCVSWFPSLANVQFTHAWGGPLGITRDWVPNVFFDKETRRAAGIGYSGQGVAMSNLAGRILAEQIAGKTSKLSELAFVGHKSRRWEVEPARSLGVWFVQNGLDWIDHRGRTVGHVATGRSLPELLSSH